MKEKFFETLNKQFAYADEPLSEYSRIASIRLGPHRAVLKSDMENLLLNQYGILTKIFFCPQSLSGIKSNNFYLNHGTDFFMKELMYLDRQNSHWIINQNINPVLKKYIEAFDSKITDQGIGCNASAIQEVEHETLNYLLNQPFEDGISKIFSVQNSTLRVIMQKWILYPLLIHDKELVTDFVDCLDISNCEF